MSENHSQRDPSGDLINLELLGAQAVTRMNNLLLASKNGNVDLVVENQSGLNSTLIQAGRVVGKLMIDKQK